jgi:cobalt-zinc-cadmium efflux system outer membrane protein
MVRILLCVAFVLLATTVQAAEKLTLEDALALADRNHPQLSAGRALVEGAAAGITTARAYPNPEAGFLAGRQFARIPSAVRGADLFYSFSQPLEIGSLRPSRLNLAERGLESSQFVFAETRLIVLSAVRRAFYGVLRRKSEISLANENLQHVENLRLRVEARVEVGESGTIELNRAQAEEATAKMFVNSARLQLVASMAQLGAALATNLDPNVELEGTLAPPAPLPPIEQLREESRSRHPMLALARAEVQRAGARVRYELALRTPQPTLWTEYERLPDNPSFRVGIALSIPLWNRREGPVAEAAAAVKQANRLAEAREVEILAGLDSAYGRYQVAGEQIVSFEQGVLKEAEQALTAAETAYQLGERGIIEVFDAQRVLRTVRQDYLTVQHELQAAQIDLDQLRAIELRSRP